jgi:hypothetical protein
MTSQSNTAPTRFVEVDGTRFAYRRFGDPIGTPIVLVQHFIGWARAHAAATAWTNSRLTSCRSSGRCTNHKDLMWLPIFFSCSRTCPTPS